ncbi:hypothetical protein [Corallococcus sp. Z5C101001]|uniref:hypothetical protein n=1 Tax=Corallococcus sp. Z5C101001 TaxID=2596829 RepID=UPI00117E50E1|nr:hypothetical protein [Corallococcus sp. Z5C101001]TSC22686.1 hypothetical protein FOF48_32770 [Corallococcus sp. Z5C101001]
MELTETQRILIQELVRRRSLRTLVGLARGGKFYSVPNGFTDAFPGARSGHALPSEGRAYLAELVDAFIAREKELREQRALRYQQEAEYEQRLLAEFLKENPEPKYPPCVDTDFQHGDADVAWRAMLPDEDLLPFLKQLSSDLRRWTWCAQFNGSAFSWGIVDAEAKYLTYDEEMNIKAPRYSLQVVEWARRLGALARENGALFEHSRPPPTGRPDGRSDTAPRIKRITRPR